MKVPVGVSNRHVHMTAEVYEKLFGDQNITFKNAIFQPGQFAAEQTITIKTEAGEIEKVRVVGPFRPYTQVEVSKTDTFKLKINPPIRTSGDLVDAETITLVGPKGEVTLKAVIIADRHLHITTKQASELGIKNNDIITAVIKTEKPGTIEVKAKVTEDAFFCIDLDTDDANGFLIANNDEIEIQL